MIDFLKEIVKEIGDDFTQLASNIDDTENYVDTGSYIFNGLVSGSIFGVYLGIRLLPSLVSLALEKLSSRLQLSRTSWILILTGIVYILILKSAVKSLFSQVGALTLIGWS